MKCSWILRGMFGIQRRFFRFPVYSHIWTNCSLQPLIYLFVPKCRLGNRNMSAPNMGWLTWTSWQQTKRNKHTERTKDIWGWTLKWWVSPTKPMGFPTKNDQLWGCFGVPPFKETPIWSDISYGLDSLPFIFCSYIHICMCKISIHFPIL